MGILFNVHNELGSFRKEKHYQSLVRQKFDDCRMGYAEQVKISIKSPKYVGSYYIDFVVENKIVLEIKAKPRFSRNDIFQVLRYLRETGMELGILVNFSRRELIYKRILRGFGS
jgi:GxxExxY protein